MKTNESDTPTTHTNVECPPQTLKSKNANHSYPYPACAVYCSSETIHPSSPLQETTLLGAQESAALMPFVVVAPVLGSDRRQEQTGLLVYGGILITLILNPLSGLLYLLSVSNGVSYFYAKKGVGIGWIIYAVAITAAGIFTYTGNFSCFFRYPALRNLCESGDIRRVAIGLFITGAILFVLGVWMVRQAVQKLKCTIHDAKVPQNNQPPMQPFPYVIQMAQPAFPPSSFKRYSSLGRYQSPEDSKDMDLNSPEESVTRKEACQNKLVDT